MINTQKLRLFFYTSAHFAVDAICAATIFHNVQVISIESLVIFTVIYNFLAFATQPIAGYFIDQTSDKKEIILLSFLMLACGFLIPFNRLTQIVFVGIANCLFHVAAGADVLQEANDKMWPLGVFVSSGAVGLALGMAFPDNTIIRSILMCLLMFIFVAVSLLKRLPAPKLQTKQTPVPYMILFGILFCISIRSFMGFVRSAPFEGIAYLPLILSVFVFTGKFIGGFLCDWLSIKKVVLIFVPLSAFCYFIGDNHFILWGMGQLLVNISMPITLYLVYKLMPNRPAFGFGLAASFLVPGAIVAVSFSNVQVPMWIFGLIFTANFILLLLGNRKTSDKPSE